jgi:predicted lipid-binding transport protein (Tim44 family)
MIFFIEVAFLIAGLYALFTAKMPSWLVGKGFKAEGNKVRMLGALMAVLLPGALCMGFTLGIIGAYADFDPTIWASVLEFVTVIIVAIIVSVVIKNIRVSDAPPAPMDASRNIEPN